MASFNRVILVGNLTRDVELKYLPSGMAVTEVGLAVNDRRKTPAGEWVDDTVFVDITLWGRQAEVAGEYLSKGASVLIEGRLKLDTWEKDGKKNSKLRVVGEKLQMLGGRGAGGGANGATSGTAAASNGGASGGESGGGGKTQSGPSRDESEYSQPGDDVMATSATRAAGGGDVPEEDIPF